MAEFKLGRIRFVWQGEWTTARSYVPDDVVAVGGQTYICVASHTASSLFQTDLTNIPTRWNLVAGGTKWEGDWSVSTYYNAGDQVKYGGTVYVCLVPHTSAATLELGLEQDQSKWQAFAQSPFWTGNWSAETRYRVNDFVVYGGTTYICNEAHTSADTVDGLELDQDKWDIFNQGIVYLGDWAEETRYKLNDIVKYGASTWICVTPHTSDTEFSTEDFELFVEGLQFENSWDTNTVYQNGDVVTYGGYSYISKTVHSGSLPTTSPDDWELYTTGFNFRGDWLDSTAYKVGDVVRSGAYTYVAILDSTNQAPPGATFWRQLNSGFKWKTSSATYTGVSGTNLIGSGTLATFDVSRVGTTYAVEVNVAGSGYAINNTIKVLGTDLGGSSPANDLVITVTGVDEGEITTVGSVGYGSTWIDAVDYQEGDVVFWGASSFVCVDSHTSSALNRPDTDLTGTIWSLLAAGSESLVLTTEGDTYFYSENGPARLPIGQDGQILRVKQGFPAWEYYGIINNLVYVGPTGVDSIDEGWGLSIDKPWASVRFALEQIEKGYHNRQAAALLRKNKQFVMKEVSNWVTYTYTVDITASSSVTNAFTCNSTANLSANMPIEFSGTVGGVTAGTKYYVRTVLDSTSFTISNTQGGILRTLTTQTANMTGTLSYDSALCERDVGLLIDALSYDIGHGGNEEVTKAARAYYTKAGGRYINSNFAEQITQTVSSYQYMVELIDDVLKNDEPATSYQVENGVAESDQVWQIIDTSLEAEDQALDLVPDLMDVVVNGLLAGSELAIPASINSNTTVSVKTGTYFEVLPMIIPKNTAVVGDELRSTVIRPQPAIANLANDREKTISALNRINDIIPNLVQNNSVIPTAGNTLSAVQVQGTLDGDNEFIEGSVGTYSAVERVETAANAIYDILSDGMAAAPVEVMPNPVGFDTGFLNARTQITNNYAFIKADVSRFIQNNYASVWTALGVEGQAKCQRDIEYILDAIRYDLTYGGNTQTLIAGRSYYTYINLVIPEATEAATLAAYTHMRSIIDDVARALTVTPQAGNSTPQSVSGSGGSTDAATFAQARMQDIIDWIDNGASPAEIQPSLSWVSADLQAGFAEIQSRKAEIQQDGLAYVNKFFQELTFNEATCSRDIAYMVDAIAYDTAFGSNFASVIAGKSYYRNLDSTALVLANQKKASLGLIKFLKYKLRGLAVGGGAAKAAVAIHSIVGTINGGKQPRYQWPSYSTIDTSDYAAAKLISQNKKFIAAEVQKFIDDNYPEIYYSETACMRDVEYILDAVRYDLTYGGSFASKQAGVAYYSRLTTALQIDADDKTATLAAYATLKSVVQAVANGGAYTPLQTDVARITGATGNADSATLAGSLIDVITDIIDDGLVDGVRTITITEISGSNTLVTGTAHGLAIGDEIVVRSTANGLDAGVTYYVKSSPSSTQFTISPTWNGTERTDLTNGTGLIIIAEVTDLPGISWVSADMITQATTLQSAKATLINLTSGFIDENYPNLDYDANTCRRDMGYVIDALTYDMLMNSNFRSIKAGLAYYQAQASKVVADQKRATLQTFRELRRLVSNTVSSSAEARLAVRAGMDLIIDILEFGPGEEVDVHGTLTYANDTGMLNASSIIAANIHFLAEEASAWITQNYGGTVTDTISPDNTFTTSAPHNLAVNDIVQFSGSVFGGIATNTQYFVTSVPTALTFTVSLTKGGTNISLSTQSSTMTVRYDFDPEACKRDMREYVEAVVYDMRWPGNYKSNRAAVLYANAVKGSEYSDMFRTRNACGLRNCTLLGLNGELSGENEFGTKRPTAGAYVALDPGFGPNDQNVWITTRSHYSQNVTMFGTGCTGAKIDSSLHTGGNKSMVKNDFTTIMSDGIGVWCTGSDSLTELVSVFNYYGYAGYIADKGGRIRATNGNSSYGTYGVIAEGVSSKETPLYARVDNKYAQAQITNTITDGTTEVLRFEFGNAGSNYSNTVHTISASGFNARAVADEYRDNAVFETRIIDPDDGQDFGGSNYVTASNAAQNGSLTEITIAATDTALTNAYNGMRVQITAGTGVGQYANILSFLNGTKVAKVYKDSFTPITVTSTTDTGDFVNVASNSTLYVNMPIYFTGTTFGGIQANQLYYVRALTGTTQFTISETEGGSAVNVTTGTGSMTLLAAGWDHAVPGKTIANALDLTTAYIIEPRVEYSAPGYTTSSVSLASATWRDIVWADNRFVAIANNSTSTTQSPTGVTWQTAGALPSSSNWTSLVYGGGSGSSATAIVGGLNGRGAQFRAILGEPNTTGAATADQIASVEVIDGGQGYDTPPVIVFTPVNGGTGATAVCAVLDGKVTAVTVTIPGSGYLVAPTVSAATDRVTQVAVNSWGRNYYTNPTVTISDPYVGTQWATNTSVTLNSIIFHTNTTVTPNLKNWYRVTTAGTTGVGGPVHTSGTVNNGTASLLYIGTTAVLTPSRVSATGTVDGVVSIAVTNTGRGYTETPTVTITDPDAKYVAIANGSTDTAYTTSATVQSLGAWTAGGALPASTFTSLAYGNAIYVAVGGTNSAVSSVNGTTFTNRVIPTLGAGTYSSVAYGNERFVAISTGNNQTAYSENGTSWVVGGTLPASTTWTSIAYGNGRFVAVASGGRNVAYSIDRGVTWVAAPAGLPVSASWTKIVYGQGLFLAIASGTAVCATSPDGVNWTQRAQPSSSSWISGAFGNPGARGTFVSVSAVSPTSIAARTLTGARALGRIRTASGIVAEARMIEPGSGYPSGTVTATAASTDLITVDNTVNLVGSMPVEFYGTSAGGLEEQFTYYVIGSTITSSGFKVSFTQGSTTPVQLDDASISGMTYRAAPVFDVIDPNKVRSAAFRARMGDGALGNPSFPNRGSDNATAQAETLGDGHANLYQPSTFIAVNGLYDVPTPGANVEFASLPGQYFKLVTVTNVLGELGNYTAVFQLNPGITVLQAPNHGDLVTTRIKYSQVRLTGHDFLYIGTGNFNQTNYPNVDISTASQDNQAQFSAGGRVFFTSTDQDGNFNVGNLFGVQQATGTATLNASAFNLSGLNSLQLGSVELGIGSAIITQFSTDPFFTADSDNVVPTQRAIKSYITAQIGGGQSSLNVNTLTSGVVYIAGNSISTTTGVALNVTSKMNFTGGIDGAPVALGFFMQR